MMGYAQEKIKPYGEKETKGVQVERMFDRIAHSYDLLNRTLSFGIDLRWRKVAIDSLRVHRPECILDVATGTGDFILLAAERLQATQLLGVDLSEQMMDIARQKVQKKGLQKRIAFQKEDCMSLSFADNTFDAITVAYGVRNFEHLDQGLKEMLRVLKPGGHLVILELCTPRRFPMKQLFYVYSHLVMPLLGRIISKDKTAYTYLPSTMAAFPQGEVMQKIMERIGFRSVSFKRFTFGLCTLYMAEK